MNAQAKQPPPKGLAWITQAALFLTGGVALVFASGFSLGPVLLLMCGVWVLLSRAGVKPEAAWRVRPVFMSLAAFGLIVGTIDALQGEGIAGYDGYSRFFLLIPVAWAVWAVRPRLTALFAGLATGAVGALAVAVWDRFYLGLERATGFTYMIPFGNIALLFGVLSLAGLGLAGTVRHRKAWIALMLAGAAAGFGASILSGTRGGWLGLPLAALCLLWPYRVALRKHWRRAAVLTLIGGVALAAVGDRLGIDERIDAAVRDVQLYRQGDAHTSLGARFDMWRFAWRLIPEKPLLGWGYKGYGAERDRQLAQGTVPETVRDFGHVHNEVLDILLKYGVVGLVLLLAMYLSSLWVFARHVDAHDARLRVTAQAGALVPLMYAPSGLSQVFYVHNSTRMVFAALIIILAAFLAVYADARRGD